MYIHEAIKASDREFPCITREAWTRIQDGALSITKLAFDGARQQFRFIGKGQQPLKPFDYSSYVMPSQVDQYPQLCMDVETPFDAEQK